MKTVRQHQKSGRWTSTKKIGDWKIDKYTCLKGKLRTQSNIHDGTFLQKRSTAKTNMAITILEKNKQDLPNTAYLSNKIW